MHSLLSSGGVLVDRQCTSSQYVARENGPLEAVHTLPPSHVDVLRALLPSGGQVDSASTNYLGGTSALWVASFNGHVGVVRALLSAGAQVDLENNQGFSPLYVACRRGHLEVACTLLSAGAQVNLGDGEGATPLLTACFLRRCMSACYCSAECQAKHWREGSHKEACPRLRDIRARRKAAGGRG